MKKFTYCLHSFSAEKIPIYGVKTTLSPIIYVNRTPPKAIVQNQQKRKLRIVIGILRLFGLDVRQRVVLHSIFHLRV